MSLRFSRRGFLKAATALGGAAMGTRLGGTGLLGNALADAIEPSHLVHIVFPGGYNALFGGCADKFIARTTFGVTSTNVLDVGNGVFTDKGTLGTLPQLALDHWAAVGVRHRVTSHLGNGAEKALLYDGTNSYLTQLAAAMGGSSPLKAVHFGDRMPYGPQPSFGGVSLQRVTDLGTALMTLGGSPMADPSAPDRALSATALTTAQQMSRNRIGDSPRSLVSVRDGYDTAIAALQKPRPVVPPVTFDQISTAYGLGGKTAVTSFASMVAGAEVMIRSAQSNVISICDPGFVLWDFHQVTPAGASRNGELSRAKFTRSIMAPLRTFIDRVLAMPDRNVVVALSGDFVRLPNGDHGDGTVVTLMGKYVKKGVSFPVDANARFAADTPGPKQFWSAAATALKVKSPFGPNPYVVV